MKKLIFLFSLVMITQLQGMGKKLSNTNNIDYCALLEARLENIELASNLSEGVKKYRSSNDYKKVTRFFKDGSISDEMKNQELASILKSLPQVIPMQGGTVLVMLPELYD